MTVPAYWALWGKNAGDRDDYHMLACSSGDRELYQRLLLDALPGTPVTEVADQIDSLPWVTFVPYDEGSWTTISLMEWSAYGDRDQRRASATRFFMVESTALAGHRLADVYAAALACRLPPPGGADAALLRPVRSGAGSPTTDVPVRWAAAAAAVLLERQAVITRPAPVGVEARLAVIDAILRLLPAGYRVDLDVATWSPLPDQKPRRLCFGPYADGDLVELRLDTAPQPVSEAAQRYHELLVSYLDGEEEDRLTEFLARSSGVVSFADGAEPAVAILEELDLPDAVRAEIRSNHGDVERTMRALDGHGPGAFGDELGMVYRFLLTAPEVPVELLGRNWSDVLCSAIVGVVADPGWKSRGASLAEAFVSITPDVDSYLAAIVPAYEAVDVCLAEILGEDRAKLSTLHSTLLQNVALCNRVVGRCLRTRPSEMPALLAWLTRDNVAGPVPAWLGVLNDVVLGRPDRPQAAERVRAAMRENSETPLHALDIAVALRRLDNLGDALWYELARTACLSEDDVARMFLVSRLSSVGPAVRSTTCQARLDVLLVVVGRRIEAPRIAVGEVAGYLTAACHTFEALDRPIAARVKERLPGEFAASRPDGTDVAVVAELVSGMLAAPEVWPRLVVVDALLTSLKGHDGRRVLAALRARGGAGWTELIAKDPRLRAVVFEQMITENARPADVAEGWAPVVLDELATGGPRSSLQALKGWPLVMTPGALLNAVMRTAEITKQQTPGMPGATFEWQMRVYEDITLHRLLGPTVAKIFYESLRSLLADKHRQHAQRHAAIAKEEQEAQETMQKIQGRLAALNDERTYLSQQTDADQALLQTLHPEQRTRRPAVHWRPGSRNPTTPPEAVTQVVVAPWAVVATQPPRSRWHPRTWWPWPGGPDQ